MFEYMPGESAAKLSRKPACHLSQVAHF